MNALLALLWVVGTIACVYFIIRPKSDWWIVSNRMRATITSLLIFIGLPIVGTITSTKSIPENQHQNSTTDSKPVAESIPATESNKTAAPATKWTYSEDVDQMRGTKTRYASLTSEDEQTFSFPYEGGHAELMIRQRPSDGLNFILSIKGQFMCNQFSNSTVAVKFDKGPVQRYTCVEPSDGRTGEIFIEGGRRFLAQLKKTKTVVIEAEFYQQGDRQMTFDARGLQWN
jgi:hypothetical protein